MSRNYFIVLLLIASAAGLGVEASLATRLREQLAAENRQLTRLEAQVRSTREQRDATATAQLGATEKLAMLQAHAADTAEKNAQAKAWWARIKKLQQHLDEMPGEKIPELKLLGMKDWIAAVLVAETGTEAQIKTLLTHLRRRARSLLANQLMAALGRFTGASGGELPATVADLLPYLAPPIDREMLDRYRMKRSGKVGPRDETLIVSATPGEEGDFTVSLGAANYSYSRSTDDTASVKPAELLAGATGDALWLAEAVDELATSLDVAGAMEALSSRFDAAPSPFDEGFGDRLKAAIKQFSAVHPNEPVTDIAQLRAFFPESDRLAAQLRPMIAQFEYWFDHGKIADTAEQLKRYVERSVEPAQTLRAMKLTVEGDEVTMTFGLK